MPFKLKLWGTHKIQHLWLPDIKSVSLALLQQALPVGSKKLCQRKRQFSKLLIHNSSMSHGDRSLDSLKHLIIKHFIIVPREKIKKQ